MFRLGVVDHVRLNLDFASQNYTVHAKAADRLAARTSRVRIGVLVLLGVATASAVTNLIEPGRYAQITTAVATLVAFAGHAAYLAFDFEGRGHVGGHHAKRLLRRAHVDRLPMAVEHQNDCLAQDFGHKLLVCVRVFVLC